MKRVATQKTETEQSARGSSFYMAMRILPQQQREAMYAIYAFCRAIDDIADGLAEREERLLQLRRWREDVERIYAGNAPPRCRKLQQAVEQFGLRKEDLLAVIDGMEMDARGPIQAPSFAELQLYCDRVAGAVGRLSVRVFGLPEAEGLALSHHLGLALQFTNILRDLDEDGGMNRLYLPEEFLKEAGIRSRDPAETLSDPAVAKACARLADEALYHFQEADQVMRRSEHKRVRAPRVMWQAYQSLHAALLERGFHAPRRSVRLNKARLGLMIARSAFF